jgi:hypothetical protein
MQAGKCFPSSGTRSIRHNLGAELKAPALASPAKNKLLTNVLIEAFCIFYFSNL